MRPMNGKAKKVEYLVAKFINDRRARRGLNRLTTDSALVSAGREHSRDMARRGFFDHVNPSGESPHDRCRRYGNVGECIAQTNDFEQSPGQVAGDIVEQLMTSPPHRRALMDSENEKMGVGIWKTGKKVYASVEFVGPKFASYQHHHGTAGRQSSNRGYSPAPSGPLERMLARTLKKLLPYSIYRRL